MVLVVIDIRSKKQLSKNSPTIGHAKYILEGLYVNKEKYNQ